MDDELELLLLQHSLNIRRLLLLKRMKRRRKYWVHPIFGARPTEGTYYTLVPRLRNDPVKFQSYFRMDTRAFDILLGVIGPR